MADAEFSDGKVTLRAGTGLNNVELGLTERRMSVGGNVGAADKMVFANGSKLHVGVGATLEAAGNYKPIDIAPNHGRSRAQYIDRMNAPEMVRLGDEIAAATGGSDDLLRMTAANMLSGVRRYPVLKPSHLDRLQRMDENLKDIAVRTNNIVSLLAQDEIVGVLFKDVRSQLSELSTRVRNYNGLRSLTLGDVKTVADVFIARNAELALDFSGSVDSNLAKFDAWAGKNALNLRLTTAQKLSIIEAFRDAVPVAQHLKDKINDLPTADEIRHAHKVAKDVLRYAPSMALQAHASVAHESAPWREGASRIRTVIGGSMSGGLYADPDSLWMIRNTENGKASIHIKPSQVTSGIVFAGAGQDTESAMPSVIARRVGIEPSQEPSSFGAYVALSHKKEELFGRTLEEMTSAELMGKYRQNDGGGQFTSVEVGVKCPIKPSTTPARCKGAVKAGITF